VSGTEEDMLMTSSDLWADSGGGQRERKVAVWW